MKQYNYVITEVLNDLIRINNDRIAGFEKAFTEIDTRETDLQELFKGMANESRNHVTELHEQVDAIGGEPAKGTTIGGKIYRIWMDVTATFCGHDPKAILASCEFGENSALKAYQAALDSYELPGELKDLVIKQQENLVSSLNIIQLQRRVITAS